MPRWAPVRRISSQRLTARSRRPSSPAAAGARTCSTARPWWPGGGHPGAAVRRGRIRAGPADRRPVQGRTEAADDDPHPADPRRSPGAQRRVRGAAGRDHGRPRHPGAVPDLAGPAGREWSGQATFSPPPRADGNSFYIGSDDAGWSPTGADHQNASRKRVYHRAIDAVAGLDATPFVRAVIVAEATSLVSNLGTKGIGYINGDLTVALSRLPIGEFVGVQGDSHWCADGISVGSATCSTTAGRSEPGWSPRSPTRPPRSTSAAPTPCLPCECDDDTALGCADYGRGPDGQAGGRGSGVDPRCALAAERTRRQHRPPAGPHPGRGVRLAGGRAFRSQRHRPGTAPAAHRAGRRGRRMPLGPSAGVPVVVYDDWNQAGSARAGGSSPRRDSPASGSSTAAWRPGGPPAARWTPMCRNRRPAM